MDDNSKNNANTWDINITVPAKLKNLSNYKNNLQRRLSTVINQNPENHIAFMKPLQRNV